MKGFGNGSGCVWKCTEMYGKGQKRSGKVGKVWLGGKLFRVGFVASL